jgi:hypothetical protein
LISNKCSVFSCDTTPSGLAARHDENPLWYKVRKGRITASIFHDVLTRKSNTPPQKLVERIVGNSESACVDLVSTSWKIDAVILPFLTLYHNGFSCCPLVRISISLTTDEGHKSSILPDFMISVFLRKVVRQIREYKFGNI